MRIPSRPRCLECIIVPPRVSANKLPRPKPTAPYAKQGAAASSERRRGPVSSCLSSGWGGWGGWGGHGAQDGLQSLHVDRLDEVVVEASLRGAAAIVVPAPARQRHHH